MSKETGKASFKFHWTHLVVFTFTLLLVLGGPMAYVEAQKAQVDLNNASQKELEALKGVGPATAKKIIAGRPYKSADDLSKAGLSAKQIEGLKPFVTVGSAAPAPAPAAKPSPAVTGAPKAAPAPPAAAPAAAVQKPLRKKLPPPSSPRARKSILIKRAKKSSTCFQESGL